MAFVLLQDGSLFSPDFDSKPRSGTARCHPISIKGRRVTPALRLRPLQPYVSAALRPERERARNGYRMTSGHERKENQHV